MCNEPEYLEFHTQSTCSDLLFTTIRPLISLQFIYLISTKYSIKIVAATPCRHRTASSSLIHRRSYRFNHVTYYIFCIYLTKLHNTVNTARMKKRRKFHYGWWKVHWGKAANAPSLHASRTFSLLQLTASTQHKLMITMMMEFMICGAWRLHYSVQTVDIHQAICTWTQYFKYKLASDNIYLYLLLLFHFF